MKTEKFPWDGGLSRKELYRRTKGCAGYGVSCFVLWVILASALAAIAAREHPAQIPFLLASLLLFACAAAAVLFLAYWKYWLDLLQKATLVFHGEVVSGGPVIGSPIERNVNWRLLEAGTSPVRQFFLYLPGMEKQYANTALIQDICCGPVSFLYLRRSQYIAAIAHLSKPEQSKKSKHAQKKARRKAPYQ